MVMTAEEGEEVEEDSAETWWNLLGTKSIYHLPDGDSKKIGPIANHHHHLHVIGIVIAIAIEIILAVGVDEEVQIGRVPEDHHLHPCHLVVTIVGSPVEIAMEVGEEEIAAVIEDEVVIEIAIHCPRVIENGVPVNDEAVDDGATVRVPIQQQQQQQYQYQQVATTTKLSQSRLQQAKETKKCQSLVMYENPRQTMGHRQPLNRVSLLLLVMLLQLLPPSLIHLHRPRLLRDRHHRRCLTLMRI